jgi:HEAT repeat protein
MAHKIGDEDWWIKYANDPRPADELIRIAIEEWGKDYDPDTSPHARTILHARGDQATFEAAIELAKSADARSRAVAADMLGEFGFPERTMPDQCVEALLRMLASETEPEALASICSSFTHHERTDRVVSAIASFSKHESEEVRFGVVIGLLWAESEQAIATLIELSRDSDEEVLDWSTFGIGQLHEDGPDEDGLVPVDTPAIREALFARVEDEHWKTRHEALSGLALRRDTRAVNHIVKMLAEEPPMFGEDLCEALKVMLEHYTGSAEQLELALKECEREENRGRPVDAVEDDAGE